LEDPAHDPAALLAVAAASVKMTVSISVDGAGLISGLLLTPHQPLPASWAQADQDLAALAPVWWSGCSATRQRHCPVSPAGIADHLPRPPSS